jgi:LPS export ABC transporter protein LptC
MKTNFSKKIKGLMVFFIALFISCADSTEALSEINKDRQEPLGTATNIRMVYTDSIKIQAILTSPKHVDYTNLSFRYAEFPEGLKVVFFDELEQENELIADYGILYNDTKLIDLRGNVKLKSHNGSILITEQLFWDAESEWLFTEKPFTFEDNDYNFEALRLDTNKEFSKFQTGSLIGTITVSEQKDSLGQQ